MKEVKVKDILKYKDGITRGYCQCGREVTVGDKECPLCRAKLDWSALKDRKE